jgi:hypothetical protein
VAPIPLETGEAKISLGSSEGNAKDIGASCGLMQRLRAWIEEGAVCKRFSIWIKEGANTAKLFHSGSQGSAIDLQTTLIGSGDVRSLGGDWNFATPDWNPKACTDESLGESNKLELPRLRATESEDWARIKGGDERIPLQRNSGRGGIRAHFLLDVGNETCADDVCASCCLAARPLQRNSKRGWMRTHLVGLGGLGDLGDETCADDTCTSRGLVAVNSHRDATLEHETLPSGSGAH